MSISDLTAETCELEHVTPEWSSAPASSIGGSWNPDEIRALERVAAGAWPAEVQESLDGWVLRWTRGFTGRANSVWPNDDCGRVPLDEKLARVDEFYSSYGTAVRYQICPAACPPHLDDALASRGLYVHAATCVQTAALEDVLGRLPAHNAEVSITRRLTDDWLGAYACVERIFDNRVSILEGILSRIETPTAYALVAQDGQPAAAGMAVLNGQWLGIFNMRTAADYRRRGLAQAALGALTEFGVQNGAERAYLQVVEANHPARSLYERCGFTTAYRYHYRQPS